MPRTALRSPGTNPKIITSASAALVRLSFPQVKFMVSKWEEKSCFKRFKELVERTWAVNWRLGVASVGCCRRSPWRMAEPMKPNMLVSTAELVSM